jgi:hypothetical protein
MVHDGIFEALFKVAVVEENVGIIKPSVEVTLNAFDRL